MNELPPEAIKTAQRLVGAVRNMDGDDVARLLMQTDAAVIVTLAAMVDDTRTPRELLAWTSDGIDDVLTWRRNLTDEQAREHWKAWRNGEKDQANQDGYLEWERRRKLKYRGYRQRTEAA